MHMWKNGDNFKPDYTIIVFLAHCSGLCYTFTIDVESKWQQKKEHSLRREWDGHCVWHQELFVLFILSSKLAFEACGPMWTEKIFYLM